MCDPDKCESLKIINKELMHRIDTPVFQNFLIKTYQVHLERMKGMKVLIKGNPTEVHQVKLMLEAENVGTNSTAIGNNAKNNELIITHKSLSNSSDLNLLQNKKETESSSPGSDEIIWINDPYEMFDPEDLDMNAFKKPARKKEKKKSQSNAQNKIIDTFSDLKTNDVQMIEVNNDKDLNGVDSNSQCQILITKAISLGFSREFAEQTLSQLQPINDITEYHFIEYLRITHAEQQKNASNKPNKKITTVN